MNIDGPEFFGQSVLLENGQVFLTPYQWPDIIRECFRLRILSDCRDYRYFKKHPERIR